MGIFNYIDKYSNVDVSEYIKSITQQIQSSGLKLDSNNNYSMWSLVRASPRCPWSSPFPKMIKYFVEKKIR